MTVKRLAIAALICLAILGIYVMAVAWGPHPVYLNPVASRGLA